MGNHAARKYIMKLQDESDVKEMRQYLKNNNYQGRKRSLISEERENQEASRFFSLLPSSVEDLLESNPVKDIFRPRIEISYSDREECYEIRASNKGAYNDLAEAIEEVV